ncbi:MAG: F0F1 ATP synthase subunit delta, partial [Arenimonas sp.]
LTLARPYARAAFAIAREQGRLAPWSQALGFTAIAAELPKVKNALSDPRVAATVINELLSPPGDADTSYQQFLTVLADNRRLTLLPEIAALFDELKADAERVVKASVTSAKTLDAAELTQLRNALKKRFDREVEITALVDESLIGGVVINTGDVVIDGSIKTKLARLHASLTN